MGAYYNEWDPFAAAWLRELIKADLIAPGEVDERSIEEVKPDDLKGFTQCHFFAGIGVWSYALRNAGWSDDSPVWTGSCPCQSFSASGKGEGFSDKRHLWPAWFRLIGESHPIVIFGEQVASKDGLAWFDVVSSDLEGARYAVGSADLCAASVGAPHIRQRLFFVAHSEHLGFNRSTSVATITYSDEQKERLFERDSSAGRMANTEDANRGRTRDAAGTSRGQLPLGSPGLTNGFWRDAEWIYCRDEKYRPVEPGTFPLAHGTPNRVGRLRGYGNAINAQVAQAFIQAYLEIS